MSKFLEELNRIDKLLKQMTERSKLICRMANMQRLVLANEYAMQLEEKAERLISLTRSLPVYTGNPTARERVRKIIANTVPVEIGFTELGLVLRPHATSAAEKRAGFSGLHPWFPQPGYAGLFQGETPCALR